MRYTQGEDQSLSTLNLNHLAWRMSPKNESKTRQKDAKMVEKYELSAEKANGRLNTTIRGEQNSRKFLNIYKIKLNEVLKIQKKRRLSN